MCHIIDEHIADSSVKNRNQWGFCERPIRRKQALANGSRVGAVFIDFQKSFDTVSHPILLHKVQAIGIFDLGMCMSGLCAISPIDLNLLLLMAANPLLAIFGLYDLPNCVGDTGDVYLYADDTTLSVTGESIDEVFAALNTMVENELQWSMNNQLTIHPIKTEATLIRKSPFIGSLPPCLGKKLDNRFSWSDHISHVRKCFALKRWVHRSE